MQGCAKQLLELALMSSGDSVSFGDGFECDKSVVFALDTLQRCSSFTSAPLLADQGFNGLPLRVDAVTKELDLLG